MVITTGDRQKIELNAEFMRRLARLKLETRMILGGVMKGEKRSRKYGTSVEFADYRDYHSGDDLRYLDWNIYARLERFFLKMFHEEEDLTVHILVDMSASMDAGEPSKNLYSRQIAAALAYISLSNMDRVCVTPFSDELMKGTQFLRGRSHLKTVIDGLNEVESGEKTNFDRSFRQFSLRHRQRSMIFVISDFLDPVNIGQGVRRLSAGKHDILLLQVLDRTELEPDLRGDWALTDAETGEVVEISVSPRLINDYKRRLVVYLDDLKQIARKLGMGYVLTTTDVAVEEFILKELVLTGFIR